MSCHASYLKTIPNGQPLRHGEEFDKSAVILGIDCERCHGTAAQHADYQAAHPNDKKAEFIAVYKTLPRAAKRDICAICHSGASACIDCHMPVKPSSAIMLYTAQKSTVVPYMVRTHRIAVYPEVTGEVISRLSFDALP